MSFGNRQLVSYGDPWDDPFGAADIYRTPEKLTCQQDWGTPNNSTKGIVSETWPSQKTTEGSAGCSQFYCSTCIRQFSHAEAYRTHLQTHMKCSNVGCKFEGIRSVIRQHEISVHMGTSKATKPRRQLDGSKWIERRKSNFPTAKRSQEIATLEQEKISRGEVLISKRQGGKFRVTESEEQKKKMKSAESQLEESCSEKVKKLLAEAEKLGVPPKRLQLRPPCTSTSLLEKLLQDDIRHERNILLQCIRYIVDNGFFEPLASGSSAEEEKELAKQNHAEAEALMNEIMAEGRQGESSTVVQAETLMGEVSVEGNGPNRSNGQATMVKSELECGSPEVEGVSSIKTEIKEESL